MNFYLNYLREKVSLVDENPPVGIVLCADKDAEEVHYATGNLDHQVFVSRYLTRLPTEEQLRIWLAEERELLARGPAAEESDAMTTSRHTEAAFETVIETHLLVTRLHLRR